MRKITVFFFCILCSLMFSAEKKSIKWLDFNEARAKAIKEKKPMLLSISAKYCGYCTKMDKETYGNKAVQRFLNKYYVVGRVDDRHKGYQFKLNGKTYSYPQFMASLELRGVPTTIFFDKTGKGIAKLPGFIPPKYFKALLNYINKACYTKKIKLREFMKDPSKCEVNG